MQIKDKTELNGFNSMRLPKLKGKVKITLHNSTTGKTEQIVGENVVTDAISDIFANNVMGGIDYSKIMPVWSNFFGGVLAFENAFAVDSETGKPYTNDYYIQGNDVNECVAHAGGTVIPTDHDDDMLRGSPTTSAFVKTENSIKQVWEWLPSHGNSGKPISALALTHKDAGDAGTGGNTWAFQNFSPFALIQGGQMPNSNLSLKADDNSFCQYDDNHSLWFHIGDSTQYNTGKYTSFTTKKLTVIIRRLPFAKSGLFETFHARSDNPRSFTVETTGNNMYMQPSYYFDYANKYLWVFYNNTSVCNTAAEVGPEGSNWAGQYSKTTVSYFVVDCENETIIDEGTITSDASDLAPLTFVIATSSDSNADMTVNAQIVKDGNYVYFPTGSVEQYWTSADYYHTTGYKKINISNQADQETITFNSTQNCLKSAIKKGGLIMNSGRVVNNGVGYSCVSQFTPNPTGNYFSGVWAYQQSGVSSLVLPVGASESSGNGLGRFIAVPKLLMTTKWNLPSAVQKTASQSMAIEYELEEV